MINHDYLPPVQLPRREQLVDYIQTIGNMSQKRIHTQNLIDQLSEKRRNRLVSNDDTWRIMSIAGRTNSLTPQEVIPMYAPNHQENLKKLIDSLSPSDQNEFYRDLLESSYKAIEIGNLRPIVDILDSWEATAEILADENVMNDIREAQEEFERGEGIPWYPGMN